MNKKIAVFGSAFNPPHKGHADAIQQLLDGGYEVFVVPSADHPFGKKMVSFDIRCQMVEALIKDSFPENSQVKLVKLEAEIYQRRTKRNIKRSVYTYDLLRHLRYKYRNSQFLFAVGPDNARDEIWKRFFANEKILKEFGRVVLEERASSRSSTIRERILTEESWESLTTQGIVFLVKSLNLYTA